MMWVDMCGKEYWFSLTGDADLDLLYEELVGLLKDEGYVCRVLDGEEEREFLKNEIGMDDEEIERSTHQYTVCTKGDRRVVISLPL